MTKPAKFKWQWRERVTGLPPQGVLAWKASATALLLRLRKMSDEQQARLSATAGPEVLIVTGAPDELPWIDGVSYIAQSPVYPALWLPTCHEPDMLPDLMGKALIKHHGRQPLLLCPNPECSIPLDKLLPVTPVLLDYIETQWHAP